MPAALLTLLTTLGVGCTSLEGDDWRFCVSREAYPEMIEKMEANEPVFDEDSLSEGVALIIVPLFLLGPLVFDLVALPVTATHDALAD